MSTAPQQQKHPVAVLGLGAMGAALAASFLDRGHPTTVWNRTASRTEPLVAAGATAAASPAEAAASSPLVVLCLIDHAAVEEVLAQVGQAIAGRVLVDLTSGSPAGARATARWAQAQGAQYLDGGVMADPPYIGTDSAVVTFSGSEAAFKEHEAALRGLGNVTFYGTDPGLAAVEFLAQVSMGYEMLIGFLHTLRLVAAEGVDPAEFASRVAESAAVGWPPLLSAIGKAVGDGAYPPDLGPLSVQAALMDDLVEHRRSLGIDVTRMVEVKRLMDARVGAGLGAEGFSSLFELLGKDGTAL